MRGVSFFILVKGHLFRGKAFSAGLSLVGELSVEAFLTPFFLVLVLAEALVIVAFVFFDWAMDLSYTFVSIFCKRAILSSIGG